MSVARPDGRDGGHDDHEDTQGCGAQRLTEMTTQRRADCGHDAAERAGDSGKGA